MDGNLAKRLIKDENNRHIMYKVLTSKNKDEHLNQCVRFVIENVLHYFLSTTVNYFDRIYKGVSSSHILSPNISMDAVQDIFTHFDYKSISKTDDEDFARCYVLRHYPFIEKNDSFLGDSFEMIPLLHKSHLYYLIQTCMRDLERECPWDSIIICKLFIIGYILAGFYQMSPVMFVEGTANATEQALCYLLCAFKCQKYWLENKIITPSFSLEEATREEFILQSMYTLATL
jgi:hypothetical protein